MNQKKRYWLVKRGNVYYSEDSATGERKSLRTSDKKEARRYSQGEIYCRRAIGITAKPPNAYKNLGLALAGQGRYREAAEAFIAATQAEAADARALRHLEALLAEHPELEFDFAEHLKACRAAVAAAEEAAAKAEAEWRAAANRQKD